MTIASPTSPEPDLDDATLDAIDSMVMNAMDYFECSHEAIELCAVIDGDTVRMFCRRKPH